MDEIKDIISTIYEWRWLFISIAATLASVQGFKAVIKHYGKGWEEFTRKAIIFVFALAAGYCITMAFMDGEAETKKWAMAVAMLNPIIYISILAYAIKKQWLWLVSILKMRKFDADKQD